MAPGQLALQQQDRIRAHLHRHFPHRHCTAVHQVLRASVCLFFLLVMMDRMCIPAASFSGSA